MRICEHDPVQAIIGPYSPGQCRTCWRYLNHEPSRQQQDRLTNPKEPGLLQKGINFAKAFGRHLANGMKLVSKEIWTKRVEICRSCPLFKSGTCLHGKCGCVIAQKASWESEHCPIQKW